METNKTGQTRAICNPELEPSTEGEEITAKDIHGTTDQI